MSSAFKRAVVNEEYEASKRMRGENGCPCYTTEGLGDNLLALSDRLFQGIPEETLRELMRSVLIDSRTSVNSREAVSNLFILVFQVRWTRGGKGAKLPFYQCVKFLYEIFPEAIKKLLPLIPSYGYWKDLLLLLDDIKKHPAKQVDYEPLCGAVYDLYANQLVTDYKALQQAKKAGTKPVLSLAAKYAPRAKKSLDVTLHAVAHIASHMVLDEAPPPVLPEDDDDDIVVIGKAGEEEEDGEGDGMRGLIRKRPLCPSKQRYRQVVSALTASLEVPEVKMCAGQFGDINMSTVPSRCLAKNMRAFGNEDLVTGGVRCVNNPDRQRCRENLIASAVSKGLKGGQNYPHEYVKRVVDRIRPLSSIEALTLEAQWHSLREGLRAAVAEEGTNCLAREMVSDLSKVEMATESKSAPRPPVQVLGHVVAMCDVSGSMDGTPLLVSLALGLLCSELAHESYRDMVLTFSEKPTWALLDDCDTFVSKVNRLRNIDWGMNTDFFRALSRVADVVRKHRLTQDQIPSLLVISDMQFDEAADGRPWDTTMERIKRLFYDLGKDLHGQPLSPPTIIFWNVRSDTVGFPAASDDEGVVLLSGYSPSLMKYLLAGSLQKELEVGGDEGDAEVADAVLVSVPERRLVSLTPREALHRILSDEGLDPVRELLASLPEKALRVPEGDLHRALATWAGSEWRGRHCGRGRGGRGGGGRGRGRRGR